MIPDATPPLAPPTHPLPSPVQPLPSPVHPPSGPDAPARPRRLDPRQLGFTPRRPVAWLAPIQLARTAAQVLLSELFGEFLDKRELQNALPARVYAEGVDEGELWFDFVADIGDGFDPTYSIAYLLAQDSLDLGGESCPRGRMLVMGGDEVYPTPTRRRYEDRTQGPYRAALPVSPRAGRRPTVYALPGNHDWYDGLTAFLRLFARGAKGHLGGWATAQSRSYFAIQLPQRWWLYAVDTQFGAYIDDPQLAYFHAAARLLRPGDKVIVCPPTPGWVETGDNPGAYDSIDYFLRTVIEPTGARVPLMLSGDLHHYARYCGAGRDLVHCGGGGAYLYPTHKLPERIQVPPLSSAATTATRHATPPAGYELRATSPTRPVSRRYAAGVFARLPWRNKSFVGLVGLVHMLFMLGVASVFAHHTAHPLTIPVTLMGLVLLLATTFLAVAPTGGLRTPKKWLFGAGHGVLHIALGVLGAWAWTAAPFPHWPWPLPALAALVIYLPVAGVVAAELVCLYLLVAGSFQVNLNELFAGQGIVDAKSFLRLHVRPDGSLTVYPVAVPRVSRRWTPQPDAPADRPWLDPAEPLTVTLAEPPFRID